MPEIYREKKFSQIDPEDFQEVLQEMGNHTKVCARNIHFRQVHDDCRDCPCHHYRKW